MNFFRAVMLRAGGKWLRLLRGYKKKRCKYEEVRFEIHQRRRVLLLN